MSEEKEPERKRPMDPKIGAVVLLGSLAVTGAITWVLSQLLPFEPELLNRFSPLTNQGAWLIIGAWTIFPVVFASAFLVLAKGVDLSRLSLAYGGVTYFLQCWAELEARDNVALWPELFFTAIATIAFYSLAKKHTPPDEDESDPPS